MDLMDFVIGLRYSLNGLCYRIKIRFEWILL